MHDIICEVIGYCVWRSDVGKIGVKAKNLSQKPEEKKRKNEIEYFTHISVKSMIEEWMS